jgi:hypothetical protein
MQTSAVAQQKFQSNGKRQGLRCYQSTGKAGENIFHLKLLAYGKAKTHQPDVLQFRIRS